MTPEPLPEWMVNIYALQSFTFVSAVTAWQLVCDKCHHQLDYTYRGKGFTREQYIDDARERRAQHSRQCQIYLCGEKAHATRQNN